ncbi:hypothetical protein AN958_06657 [Leucoagaricus sp. SymC.cos]|nr:hypothetical protein AN958_06657 [Leucoagaricus sp. SymC.cos]
MTQEKVAKVHSHHTQRAKPKGVTDRKVTFKGVLDNPHRVPWPSIQTNIQNSILALLVDLLDGVAEFHRDYSRSRKRKRKAEKDNSPLHTKKQKPHEDPPVTAHKSTEEEPSLQPDLTEKSEPPPILQHLIYGINAVTKRLERQIGDTRSKSVLATATQPKAAEENFDPIRYLFVCRADINPPILIDHLPHLVATYNVLRKQELPPIILATLPKGAEATLAQAVGVRRLAVLAIGDSSVISKERLTMLDSLETVTAPWLSSNPAGTYIQTHIKQLRTTTPRDMKAAKEARVKGRATAKALRLSRKTEVAVSTTKAGD